MGFVDGIFVEIGKAILVVENEKPDCEGCFFNEYGDWCGSFECRANERKDGKNVVFKAVTI